MKTISNALRHLLAWLTERDAVAELTQPIEVWADLPPYHADCSSPHSWPAPLGGNVQKEFRAGRRQAARLRQENEMKFTSIIARLRLRRSPGPSQIIEPGRDWTIRDWADLPVHHPRSN
ncbi:MAG: hypothetical protein ABIO40_07105 [Devosia sp.]